MALACLCLWSDVFVRVWRMTSSPRRLRGDSGKPAVSHVRHFLVLERLGALLFLFVSLWLFWQSCCGTKYLWYYFLTEWLRPLLPEKMVSIYWPNKHIDRHNSWKNEYTVLMRFKLHDTMLSLWSPVQTELKSFTLPNKQLHENILRT